MNKEVSRIHKVFMNLKKKKRKPWCYSLETSFYFLSQDRARSNIKKKNELAQYTRGDILLNRI
ncbi:hypothetical protein BD560DRAFT_414542 [Blakeslea trispora]|nr:hypothetical protein BD560DRAFT_414542 [Blakeslea trispora]